MFPAQRMWPLDGGKYLGTGDAVITKDPETGRINVGTYRMMIKGPREVGVYTSPGKDATHRPREMVEDGQADADRGLLRHRSAAVPRRRHEPAEDRERVRLLFRHQRRADRAVHQSDLTGLPLPARAEIILEGLLYPDETFAEGPFGEFTGYYGRPQRRDALHAGRAACAIATTRRSPAR